MAEKSSNAPVPRKMFLEKRKGEVYCGVLTPDVFQTVKGELGLEFARLGETSQKRFNPSTQKNEDHFAMFTLRDEYVEKIQYFKTPQVRIPDEALTVGTYKQAS